VAGMFPETLALPMHRKEREYTVPSIVHKTDSIHTAANKNSCAVSNSNLYC